MDFFSGLSSGFALTCAMCGRKDMNHLFLAFKSLNGILLLLFIITIHGINSLEQRDAGRHRGELPISYWSPKSYLINFSVINEYKRHLMIKISSKCEIRNRNKTF